MKDSLKVMKEFSNKIDELTVLQNFINKMNKNENSLQYKIEVRLSKDNKNFVMCLYSHFFPYSFMDWLQNYCKEYKKIFCVIGTIDENVILEINNID